MTSKYNLVVLGAAESGVGAAELAVAKGVSVFVSDAGPIAPAFLARLQALNIPFEQGGHTEEVVLAAHEVVKSPGIPDKAPLVKKLRAQGTLVMSEIEWAMRYTKAKVIGITGSNGKTTTTLLTYHLLKEAGLRVGLAGNVGYSMAAQVIEDDVDWYVVEISSFQLDGMYASRLDVGILLNITPDHLDRYEYDFNLYAASKFRLLQNMTANDLVVVCPEVSPPVAERLASHPTPAKILRVSPGGDPSCALYIANQAIHVGGHVIPLASLPFKGSHNYINTMCALAAGMSTGAKMEDLIAALATFSNAPHRLQVAGNLNGTTWVNDSKATNVDSVFYALQSYSEPHVLIMGGVDKGNDYDQIADLVREKVHTLVMMGKDNTPLINYFTPANGFDQLTTIDTHSFEQAMEAAKAAAQPGDVVLLSPACASFDLFRNYEDRGNQFLAWVKQQLAS